MDNQQVARILTTIGNILEIKGENPFKVRAYHNAARTIESLPSVVAKLVEQKKLGDLPGIGEAIEEKIMQLVTTGRMDYFEEVRRTIPQGVLELLKIPGVGPKKVKALWEELGVTDVESLKKACGEDKVAKMKGFGERSQQKIAEGIQFISQFKGQYRLDESFSLAESLLAWVKKSKYAIRASLAGSIRRGKEVVRDIDILVSSDAPKKVTEHFLKANGITEVLSSGETKTSVRLSNGIHVDLRVIQDNQYAPALAYFTGSKEHNVKIRTRAVKMGLTINEYGVFRDKKLLPCPDEVRFYTLLGLSYVPPEMREDSGEIELAEKGSIPDLIDEADLTGIFHNHSTWSDGRAEIDEMADEARRLGFQYIGLSDHSKSATYARGLDEKRLEKQRDIVSRLNKQWHNFQILLGTECDILPDGRMDFSDNLLKNLDFVIGSIHSQFEMPREAMTKRTIRALSNPYVDMLGHPTGRMLLSRDSYQIDLDSVLLAAKKYGKIIELNANPYRLDLDWHYVKRARELGVLISINPDAHSIGGISDYRYGIATARRGWLGKEQVFNTRPLPEVFLHLRKLRDT